APEKGAADETHRVRRDAVGRLLELAREDAVGVDAVLPVLGHAVGDPHHLVRQAAMAALRSLSMATIAHAHSCGPRSTPTTATRAPTHRCACPSCSPRAARNRS